MNRGFLQTLVLMVLDRPMYGYRMMRFLEGVGFTMEESTLYPLLRRLEKYGLIESAWTVGNDRPRKYYSVSPKGREAREKLLEIQRRQEEIMERVREAINKHMEDEDDRI